MASTLGKPGTCVLKGTCVLTSDDVCPQQTPTGRVSLTARGMQKNVCPQWNTNGALKERVSSVERKWKGPQWKEGGGRSDGQSVTLGVGVV